MKCNALVVFDIDGTLFETARVTVPAVQRTFAEYGLPRPDAERIVSFFGEPARDYEAWLETLCPPGMAPSIIEETNALELRLIAAEGRLFPGAESALAALKTEGHTLALCSNGPEDYVAEFARAYGMDRFVSAVRARGIRPEGKITMLGEILGEIEARPVIVVGDRHDDVASAHHWGAKAVGAAYGYGKGGELADANALVKTAGEIPGVIAGLLR